MGFGAILITWWAVTAQIWTLHFSSQQTKFTAPCLLSKLPKPKQPPRLNEVIRLIAHLWIS